MSYSGVTVSYESPSGESWVLISPERGVSPRLPIFLADTELEGLAGKPERGESASVTRMGARHQGWSLPPLDVSFEYWARADPGGLEQVLRSWRRSWDFEEPGDYGSPQVDLPAGRLQVYSPAGDLFWAEVSDPVFPDFPVGVNRLRSVKESLSCRVMAGHWWGSTQRFTGEAVVRPPGDRPLSPALRLVWDGSASSVTFPSGLSVSFPSIGGPRFINLDRGMSGQMTRLDGSVDTGGWSSLQGIVHGMSLRPGVETAWDLGPGMTLEVTPRYLSPWR